MSAGSRTAHPRLRMDSGQSRVKENEGYCLSQWESNNYISLAASASFIAKTQDTLTLKYSCFEIRDVIIGGFCCVLVQSFSTIVESLFDTDRFCLLHITRNSGIKTSIS